MNDECPSCCRPYIIQNVAPYFEEYIAILVAFFARHSFTHSRPAMMALPPCFRRKLNNSPDSRVRCPTKMPLCLILKSLYYRPAAHTPKRQEAEQDSAHLVAEKCTTPRQRNRHMHRVEELHNKKQIVHTNSSPSPQFRRVHSALIHGLPCVGVTGSVRLFTAGYAELVVCVCILASLHGQKDAQRPPYYR